ncbi:MAG: hypothetical protein RLZZ221_1651 [Verrucomicrobiota bacterium]
MRPTRRQFIAAGTGAILATGAGCGRAGDDLRRRIGLPTHRPLEGDLTPPGAPEIDPISHVLNRLTFGARPGDHRRVAAMGVPAFIEEQLAPDRIDDRVCDRVIRRGFDHLEDPRSSLLPRDAGAPDPLARMFPALDHQSTRVGELYEFKDKTLLEDLSRATLLRAVLSERQLLEVMVQFWTDHFNIDPSKGESRWLKAADDRDVIRAHALGDFRMLLRASAVSPAMLWYLDGRVNRRAGSGDRPNENYARELLELHTLGVHGGYTQQDVLEVARCLTGWTVRDRKRFLRGRVEFVERLHDNGPKKVLGQEIPAGLGPGDLDRVLDIVAAHPATARHLAWKLCRRFIADEPPETAMAAVAAAFTAAGGSIPAALRALFATPEFNAPATRAAKFKRPFHYVVSALRATNARTDASRDVLDALVRLGHAPFRWATPDGYPEEATHWQNTLLWRWNFATALVGGRVRGSTVDAADLKEKLGGDDALMATVLGRRPSEAERVAYHQSGSGLALLLASPAFQSC